MGGVEDMLNYKILRIEGHGMGVVTDGSHPMLSTNTMLVLGGGVGEGNALDCVQDVNLYGTPPPSKKHMLVLDVIGLDSTF